MELHSSAADGLILDLYKIALFLGTSKRMKSETQWYELGHVEIHRLPLKGIYYRDRRLPAGILKPSSRLRPEILSRANLLCGLN
jgi:hypothetical protein